MASHSRKVEMATPVRLICSLELFPSHRPTSLQLCASASVVAFWPVSSLASADRPAQHRQSHLILLVVCALSLDQPLIGQALSSDTIDETIKPRESVVLHIALVEPEGELIDIAAKMLRARVVVDT